MSLRENQELGESLKPIPEWLTILIPTLGEIKEISMLPPVVIAELEAAYRKMKKDEHDIQEIITAGPSEIPPPLTWSEHLARVTFAYAYCKNFKLRITMRDHQIYQSSRAPNQKLNNTFKTRDCAPHLTDCTWSEFYNDIDEALLVTQANITRALIDTSLKGASETRTQATETINVQLVGAVIYLRLLGYAYYPDLTL